jgi:HTH-type transcriptional regulator / antitoxin MqsA
MNKNNKNLAECSVCGAKSVVRLKKQTLSVPFRTTNKIKTFNLSNLSFEKCSSCGEIYFSCEDSETYEKELNEALVLERQKNGLLTGSEIKEIRENLGYSQAQFEKLLGLGSKSFARWETYRTDQSKSTDLLLRAIKKGGKDFLEELLLEKNYKKAA